jgi:hypothetical protein
MINEHSYVGNQQSSVPQGSTQRSSPPEPLVHRYAGLFTPNCVSITLLGYLSLILFGQRHSPAPDRAGLGLHVSLAALSTLAAACAFL